VGRKDTALVCASLFRSRKTKKRKHYWALDNGSKITEKKILVSTRKPVGVTIMCIDRIAIKANNIFTSVCQIACPRQTARFPADGPL
jgi:hypothetical protein